MALGNRSNARPGDLTGQKKAELQAEHAEIQEQRSSQIALATAEQKNAFENEVVDLEPTDHTLTAPDDIQVLEVDRSDEKVEFRTNSTFDATIGHGNDYSFVEGQRVKGPRFVYDHLEEKGLVWH